MRIIEFWIIFLLSCQITDAEIFCDKNYTTSMSCCMTNCSSSNETSTCNQTCPDGLALLSITEIPESCNHGNTTVLNNTNTTDICVRTCPDSFTAFTNGNFTRCISCSKFCEFTNTAMDDQENTTCVCNSRENMTYAFVSNALSYPTTNVNESTSSTLNQHTDDKIRHTDNEKHEMLFTVVYTLSSVCGLFVFLFLVAVICCCRWRYKYSKFKNRNGGYISSRGTTAKETEQNFYQEMEKNEQQTAVVQCIRPTNNDGTSASVSNDHDRQTYWKINEIPPVLQSNGSPSLTNEININGKTDDIGGEYVSMPTQHSIIPGSLDTEMNIYDEAMTNSDDIEKKKNEGKTIGVFKKGKAGKAEKKKRQKANKTKEETNSKLKVNSIDKASEFKINVNEYGDLPQSYGGCNKESTDKSEQTITIQEYIDMADVSHGNSSRVSKEQETESEGVSNPSNHKNKAFQNLEVYETMTANVSKQNDPEKNKHIPDVYETMTGNLPREIYHGNNNSQLPDVYQTMTGKDSASTTNFEQSAYEAMENDAVRTRRNNESGQPSDIVDTYTINMDCLNKQSLKQLATKTNKKTEKSKKNKKEKKSKTGKNADEQSAYENHNDKPAASSSVELRVPRIDLEENKYESMGTCLPRSNPDLFVSSSVYDDAASVLKSIGLVPQAVDNNEGTTVKETLCVPASKQVTKVVNSVYGDVTAVRKNKNDLLSGKQNIDLQNKLPQTTSSTVSLHSVDFDVPKPVVADTTTITVFDSNSNDSISNTKNVTSCDSVTITPGEKKSHAASPQIRDRRSSGSYDVIVDDVNVKRTTESLTKRKSDLEWTGIKDMNFSSIAEIKSMSTETPTVEQVDDQKVKDTVNTVSLKIPSSALQNCHSFREKLSRRLKKIECDNEKL